MNNYYAKNRKFFIKTSKLEIKFARILSQMGLKFERQYRVGYKFYDFFLPDYNILVETDGDYWHGNSKKFKVLNKIQIKSIMNDYQKDGLAKIQGYKLIRF